MNPYDLVPFMPEPVEKLVARFPQALETMNDLRGPLTPPGMNRACVFDFDIGVRLIASRDTDGNMVFTHLSFGVCPGSRIGQEIAEDPNASRGDAKLQAIARDLAKLFVGAKEPALTLQTDRAFHLFYK